jgi:hypothetical protein
MWRRWRETILFTCDASKGAKENLFLGEALEG